MTMQIFYPHLANEFYNQALFSTDEQAEAISRVLLARMFNGGQEARLIEIQRVEVNQGKVEVDERQNVKHVTLVKSEGVAVIPVHGAMRARGAGLDANSRPITSYETIGAKVQAAAQDDDVEHIVFDFDTHGGVAAGAFELANQIRDLRGVKPTTAVINHSAYSAGYLLASAADKIQLSLTGGVGSIGTVAKHIDLSAAEEKAGVKVTTVSAGRHKTDMSPHEPLTDQALQVMNQVVQEANDMFINAVAENRGMHAESVRGTEAALYRGERAIEAGLVDELIAPQVAVDGIAGAIAAQRAERRRAMSVRASAANMQIRL